MAEIAALLRRSEGAVSRTLQKVQVALKAELGEQDWKTLLQGMFAAIQPEESLRAEVETALAQGKTGRSPAVKYAAAGALALVVVIAFVAAPLLESRPAQGAVSSAAAAGAVPGKTAEENDKTVQFLLFSHRKDNGSEITITDILIKLPDSKTETRYIYPDKIYETIYEFGLQCSGSEKVKRVTYTALNCKLMRKGAFRSMSSLMDGEMGANDVKGIYSEEIGDATIYYAYFPIGYVISTDLADVADKVSLGVQFTYQVKRGGESSGGEAKDYTPEVSAARQKAAQDASIQLEAQMEDGSLVRRTVKFGYDGTGTLTAWLEDD